MSVPTKRLSSLGQLKTGITITVLFAALPLPASAWDKNDGAFNMKHSQECSSCHVAFSPAFLSAESWQAVMGGLDKHFGFDVSLDKDEVKEIERFLVNHAGVRKSERGGKPLLRVTETRWFIREHADHLAKDVWKNPAVKSPVNCIACHSAADKGNYSERTLKLPKGLEERE